MVPVGHISVISRFPVKSLGGERVTTTQLGPLGIAGDRLWALRDVDTGKILSAKLPSVGRHLLNWSARLDSANQPLITIAGVEFGNDLNAAATKASEVLGRRVALEAASTADEVYESFWPQIDGLAMSNLSTDLPIAMSTIKGTFVDLAALHIVTTASIEHLAGLARESTIDINRFRPSMVIDTGNDATGFVENSWVNKTASLGSATLQFSSVSPRCVMTTLAQPGHLDDPRVLQTLAKHNRQDFAGFGYFACLGIYAEVVEPGTVSIGDALRLL
jgi:uncharacterized protein